MKHAPHLQEFLKVQAASIKRSPTVLGGTGGAVHVRAYLWT